MTDLEVMQHAQDYIKSLANGVDPLAGEIIENDSVINNIRISRCLFYVSDVLQKVIDNGGDVNARKITKGLLPFSITEEQIGKIEIKETPVGISEFAKRIAAVLNPDVKAMPATHITQWLMNNGYLAENTYSGKKQKVTTQKGQELGIVTIDGVSKTGIPFKKNVYTVSAQMFIVENLNKIASDIAAEKM